MRPAAENRVIRRTAWRAAGIMGAVVASGTLGYRVLEGWPWLDSVYMTVITIATVGYGEIHPLSDAGRVFTVLLILGGVGNLTYLLGTMTEFFAAGGWNAYRRRARMQDILDTIHGHTIVCGYGRLGTAIVRGLRENQARVVVVERNTEVLARLRESRIPCVQGDAEDDEVLKQAGIQRAHALVAALDDDASNVFLCLTARVLQQKLVIYAKADDPATLTKLKRAGADHGFSPALVAGHRIAAQIVRPAVTDLIGIATDRGRTELAIEEVRAGSLAGMTGVALAKSRLWGKDGVMVLAVKSPHGLQFPPKADHILGEDDLVVVMGKVDSLARVGVGQPEPT